MTQPPGRTALYRLYDRFDQLLYVGVTQDPAARFKSHTEKAWWCEVARKEISWFDTRAMAVASEAAAIASEFPWRNVDGNPRRAGLTGRAAEYQSVLDELDAARATLNAAIVRELRKDDSAWLTALGAAAAEHHAAADAKRDSKARLNALIHDALAAGHRQIDVARTVGVGRERIRQINEREKERRARDPDVGTNA